MPETFHAQILTPDGKLFDGQVHAVQVPGVNGRFEMRYNHAPVISTLEIGQVRVATEHSEINYYAVSGGFVEMNNNKMTLLAEAAEKVEEIDVERAERAKNRALEELMKRKQDKKEIVLALKRAENRLKIKEEKLGK
jgi:F-type H+-transporting ATPase subunit epsilon